VSRQTSRIGIPKAFAALAALGAALVLLPLAGLLFRAPWSQAAAVLTSPQALDALRLSVLVSVCAAIASLVIGLPLAWVLARWRSPFRGVLRALVVLPLVIPPVVGGVALLTAFGRRGLAGPALELAGVQLPFSTAGAVLAATFVSFPLLVLTVESGLRALDLRLEGAAMVMGASSGVTIRRVILPQLAPQIVAGMVLAWARALGEFGATIMFAGNMQGRTQTLPLAVFEVGQRDPAAAIVLSLLLVAVALAVLLSMRGRVLGGT
jgi:molybdate transport system permease protein